MKLRECGPKTLDEAVSRALQIEAMYEAESRRGKGQSVRVVQESSMARIANSWSHQTEYSCHEPYGQLCAAAATTATTAAVKRAEAKRSGTGTERGSRERSPFSTLFQVP